MAKHLIEEQLEKRILILDGAMGTMLQNENLSADDFGGEELDGCNENLVLTRPDVIEKIHLKYLEGWRRYHLYEYIWWNSSCVK